VVPLTTLGLVIALLSLGVVTNFRGWTQSLADHGQRLSRRGGIRGALFRGQYSGLMIRVMALQAAAVALMFPAATLSYVAGGPRGSLAVPIVTYLVAFLAAMVLVVSTRISSRFQRMDAPVFGVVMFVLFIAWSVSFAVLGNLSSFLFSTTSR
jgi:hypothetical protein